MEKDRLVTAGIVIFILLIAGGIIFFKNFQGSTIADIPSEKIAKWIGEHSVLYVQTGCIHCEEQEALFRDNVRYLNILDGIKEGNRQKFINAGIEGTPTWVINGQKYEGKKTIEELKVLTGYKE